MRRQGASDLSPRVRPRSDWAGADHPPGPLVEERPGDVRFLLVHHSVDTNDYGPDDVPAMLRSIFGAHTGEKGWSDVAYNFFVDRFGTIWEGRAGSAERPVRGDATGGSQGFALLCCLLGDHRVEPPTPPAEEAVTALLADLAVRYDIDVRPGATASFVSRGSGLHPVGTSVTTPTIAGHRDMSATVCPGDAAYAWVTGRLRDDVAARVTAATTTTTTTTTTTAPTTTAAPTTGAPATTAAPTTGAPTTTTTAGPTPGAAPTTGAPQGASPDPSPASGPERSDRSVAGPVGGLSVLAAGLGGLIALRRRRRPDPDRTTPRSTP